MFQLRDVRAVRGGRTVLDIPELSLPSEGLTAVLGHNGSGKSTLASLLSGLAKPESGTVFLNGRGLSSLSERERAKAIAFLPQKLPASEGLVCRELVRLGRYPWRGLLGRWNEEDERRIDEAMRATGTERFARAYADKLSGGERQRVWIAMLLAQNAPVMLLDEPTSALDVRHQYGVMALLRSLTRASGRGAVVIVHDVNLALRYADRVLALRHGRLLFSGSVSLLESEENLRTLFETDIRLVDRPAGMGKAAIVCV